MPNGTVHETLKGILRTMVRAYVALPLRGKTRLRSWTDSRLVPNGDIEVCDIGPCRVSLSHAHEATRNMAYACYETRELAAIRTIVQRGDTVADIGANVGYMAAQLAGMVGPEGRVYAFEPGPTPLGLLHQTAASNRYRNIQVVEMAVSDHVGQCAFFETEAILSRGYGRIDVRPGARFTNVKEVTVPVTTLDEFLAGRDARRLSFIKIDVEGQEKQVVSGMAQLLASGQRPALMTEVTLQNTGIDELQAYAAVLEEAGYIMHRFGRRLEPCVAADLRRGFHGNVMWLSRHKSALQALTRP